MRDMYEFNRDAILSILENPKQSFIDLLAIVGIFGLLYVTLWLGDVLHLNHVCTDVCTL